jgi:hypothetical protein
LAPGRRSTSTIAGIGKSASLAGAAAIAQAFYGDPPVHLLNPLISGIRRAAATAAGAFDAPSLIWIE